MKKLPSEVARIVGVLIGTCMLASATALLVIYDSDKNDLELALRRSAEVQADIISMLSDDLGETSNSQYCDSDSNTKNGSWIDQLITVFNRTHLDSLPGSVNLARLHGDSIVFLSPSPGPMGPLKVPLTSALAEPMRRALQGESGFVEELDYAGKKVMAAYQPIPSLRAGLVVSVPVAAAREAYWKATGTILLANLVLVLFGTVVLIRLMRPVISRLDVRNRELADELKHRLEIEEQLQGSLSVNAAITQSSQDAMVMVDEFARISFWNPAAEEIFGFSAIEVMGRDIHSLIARDQNREQIDSALKTFRALGTGAAVGRTLELRANRKDGSVIVVELSLSARQHHGAWQGIGIARDVTARIKAEQRMRTLELAVERSGEVVFMTAMNGIFTYVNPAFQALYGYDAHEVIDIATPRILKSGQVAAAEYGQFWDKLNEDGMFRGEFCNVTKDGRAVVVAVCVSTITDEHGCKKGYLAIQRDVTQTKHDEKALKESESLLSSVSQSMTEGLIVTALDGTVLHVNSALAMMCGFSEDEIVGHPVDTFVPRVYQNLVRSKLESRRNGASSSYEMELQRKDGSTFPVFISAGPYIDNKNTVQGSVAVISDITERQKTSLELQRLEAQLRQAQKMEAIGTLAGGIAHDFNNILTPIMAYTDMARMTHQDDPDLNNDLGKVLQAAERAKDLVKQILTFSRQRERENLAVQPGPIIKEALKLIRATLPATIEIVEQVSSKSEVIMDPTQVHQIIMNLCTNAAWAMKENGGTLRVTLRDESRDEGTCDSGKLSRSAGCVRLIVEDNGCGMDEATLARIFDPFFTTKPVGEGTGLGLPVVHGIVVAAGGSINVASESGVGTKVSIRLPIHQGEPLSTNTYESLEVRGSERVLIIDDEPQIAESVSRSLAALGYTITFRTSGRDGVEAFRSNADHIDVVVTDFAMPQVTGLQIASQIREVRQDVPIILMTGYSSTLNETNATEYGVDRLIMKPVIGQQLAAAIRAVLDKKKSEQVTHVI